ncbi:MAG: hypothetical protein KY476_25380 [Planctomycetes bacterium]|nr:hypothetical protein [Planctomycetota bacterium]
MNRPDELSPSLDQLLAPTDGGPDESLREDLLQQTTRVVRRRRHGRRAALFAACVACYAAGAATMSVIDRLGEWQAADPRVAGGSLSESGPAAKASSDDPPPSGRGHAGVDDATRRERSDGLADGMVPLPPHEPQENVRQESAPRNAFESLSRLGDVYFHELHDPAGGVRCYEMALRTATPDERSNAFARLWRNGDGFLKAGHDPGGALACYRLALEIAKPDERALAARSGSYLLRALNEDFQQETAHENVEG